MTLSPEISSSISKLGILFRVQIKLRYLRLKHIPSDLPKSKLDLDREVNISVPKFCCKIRWPGTYNLWPCTHAFCVCHTLCQCAHLHLPWNCLAWATESCDCGGRAPCIRIPMTVHWITQTDRYPFIRSIPLFGQWNKIQPFINLQLTKFPKQASLTSFFSLHPNTDETTHSFPNTICQPLWGATMRWYTWGTGSTPYLPTTCHLSEMPALKIQYPVAGRSLAFTAIPLNHRQSPRTERLQKQCFPQSLDLRWSNLFTVSPDKIMASISGQVSWNIRL